MTNVTARPHEIGVNEKNLAVVGNSVGGNMAASVALLTNVCKKIR